jgi:hypothetical protein
MVREPDATRQPTPHDDQLMSKYRVLSFKPQLRLEWRGQDGQNETEQPDHSASLGDSIAASTRIRFSVHTTLRLATDSRMSDRPLSFLDAMLGNRVLQKTAFSVVDTGVVQ